MKKQYKHIKRCLKADCNNTAIEGSSYCNVHQVKLQVCNPKGHNKYTPKAELVGKKESIYRLMTSEERRAEIKRLADLKIYHMHFALSYSQRVTFLRALEGLEPNRTAAMQRAQKDFEEKEGRL